MTAQTVQFYAESNASLGPVSRFEQRPVVGSSASGCVGAKCDDNLHRALETPNTKSHENVIFRTGIGASPTSVSD